MALGALIIQTKFQFSDREFVEQITENPECLPVHRLRPMSMLLCLCLLSKRHYHRISRKMAVYCCHHLCGQEHSAKKIRKALRKQLGYVARDIGYLEKFMSDGYAMID